MKRTLKSLTLIILLAILAVPAFAHCEIPAGSMAIPRGSL